MGFRKLLGAILQSFTRFYNFPSFELYDFRKRPRTESNKISTQNSFIWATSRCFFMVTVRVWKINARSVVHKRIAQFKIFKKI